MAEIIFGTEPTNPTETMFELGSLSSSAELGFGHSKLLLLCFVQVERMKLNSE